MKKNVHSVPDVVAGAMKDVCLGGTLPVALEECRHYLYVVACADGSWYTGYTTNVAERIKTHNAGAGAKYTRSRGPVELVAQAKFTTKHEAMSAEYRFKRLSRAQKECLVNCAEKIPFEQVLLSALGEEEIVQP